MSVQKMKKINICALKEDRKRILEYIQRKGCIEISKFEEDDFEKMNTATQISVFERSVVSCENALEVLSLYSEEKTGMFDSLKGKTDISEDEFIGIESTHRDLVADAKEITNYGKEIDDLNLEIAKCEDEKTAIEPWTGLDVPMNTRGTRTTDLLLGIIPGAYTQEELNIKVSQVEGFPEETEVKIVSSDDTQTYIAVITDKEVKEETEDALRKLDFTKPVYYTHHLPTESIRRRNERITTHKAEIENLTNRIKAKEDLKFRIEEVADYYRVRADKYKVLGELEQSKHTFVITGSIPENEVDEIKATLENKYTAYVDTEDYVDEEAPVLLK
ncbi:MAG: V-type ATP synthase subunit I, partial [Eubacterium sp.]|nr:V-type ATP synthase subunit I [Eubacterium sp.]